MRKWKVIFILAAALFIAYRAGLLKNVMVGGTSLDVYGQKVERVLKNTASMVMETLKESLEEG